jgi:PTS system fructose-specific IIC component/PTS system nitrogen regulatory IIA component
VTPSPLTLRELFPRDRIRTDLASVDKETLFQELVDVIASTSPVELDRSELLACIMEREALMSTGIRAGVAVPHGKSGSVDKLFGAIGISKAGIDYDAGDGKPVYLAFMIVSPRRNPEVHLQTLKLLAEALELAGFAEALIQAADSDAAFHVIEKFEGLLGCA